MYSRNIKIAFVAFIIAASVGQANAYKIIYDSDTKKWSGVCKDGHQFVVGDGSSQLSESQAAKICAKHGGLRTNDKLDGKVKQDNKKPAGTLNN